MPLLYRLVPESSSLKKGWVAMKLLGGDLDYNVWKMFNKLGCDTIYEVGGHIRLKSDQTLLVRTEQSALAVATGSEVWAPRW